MFGIFCSHAYPHSSRATIEGFPRHLKGSDLVLYSVFKSLGLKTSILPVLDQTKEVDNEKIDADRDIYDYEEFPPTGGWRGRPKIPIWTTARECLEKGSKLEVCIDHGCREDFYNCDDIETRWKVLLMGRRIEGMATFVKDAKARKLDTTGLPYKWDGARVGKSLYPYQATRCDGISDEEDEEEVRTQSLIGIYA